MISIITTIAIGITCITIGATIGNYIDKVMNR